MKHTITIEPIELIRDQFIDNKIDPKEVCLRDAEILEIAAGQIREALTKYPVHGSDLRSHPADCACEDCFTFSHKLKKKSYSEKARYAQISFNHPHLDHRFQGNQHVSSGEFQRERNIDDIRQELMAEAMDVCDKYSVIVREDEK